MAVITNTLIERGMSSRGGWSAKQLSLLGLELTNLRKGWKLRIEGNEISEDDQNEFLALKDAHLNPKDRKCPKHPTLF